MSSSIALPLALSFLSPATAAIVAHNQDYAAQQAAAEDEKALGNVTATEAYANSAKAAADKAAAKKAADEATAAAAAAEAAKTAQNEATLARRRRGSSSIATSAQGVLGQASVTAKTLLGQ